jgi:hypothetical protein
MGERERQTLQRGAIAKRENERERKKKDESERERKKQDDRKGELASTARRF